MKEINTDVIIIGSGLVGLVAAHCLASLKYNVVLVDKKNFTNSKTFSKDIRTVAVSEGSKQFLEGLLLWSYVKEYAEPIKMIKVYDRTPLNKILFKNAVKSKKLGYVIENSKFNKVLRDRLVNKKNIKIFYASKVVKIISNKKSSKIYLENQIINSKLIVAADGKNSSVRTMVGNKIYKKNYTESAFVSNFIHEKPLNNTAYEIFYNTGPLAILPMKPSKKFYQSSIIWSNKNFFVNKLIRSNDDFVAKFIEEKIGEITGKIIKINSKQMFPLSAHINDKFFNERLVYIGDSAHSIHPIAGQGWNLGIKDVKNLNHICEQFRLKNLDIGNDFFCKKYNDLSYKNAFQLYQVTDKLNIHFKEMGNIYRILSNAGFQIIEKTPPLKNLITKYAMGV